ETREFPAASERSLIPGRITRLDATPRNPNAMIRKGADTAPNKTRYDIRRLSRLLNVRLHESPRHIGGQIQSGASCGAVKSHEGPQSYALFTERQPRPVCGARSTSQSGANH